MPTPRRPLLFAVAGGIMLGQMLGPAVAWAADRLDVNWPNVFRVEAERTIPIQVERPVQVRLDRYDQGDLPVKVQSLPSVKVEGVDIPVSKTPSFGVLRQTDGATWFAAGTANGRCAILRYDHQTGQVSRVGSFDL
ncbi:MAG: hypothetical protein HZB16_02425 [Armatimonadetes bacterium]|nr:hypothetical protein [Armatimonadota bacterium]